MRSYTIFIIFFSILIYMKIFNLCVYMQSEFVFTISTPTTIKTNILIYNCIRRGEY